MAETSEQRFPRGRPLVVIVADLKDYLFGWRLDCNSSWRMLVGDDDIVSWRKPFNTPLGSFHTCCRRQPTKAALRLHLENVELRHGVAVTKKQWVGTEIESQARLAVHKCERLKLIDQYSVGRPAPT